MRALAAFSGLLGIGERGASALASVALACSTFWLEDAVVEPGEHRADCLTVS
jgi:hypothetical protein